MSDFARRIGGSSLNKVASLLEKVANFARTTKFSTLIETYSTISARRSMASKERTKEVHRRRFITANRNLPGTTLEISNQTIARFTMQTDEPFITSSGSLYLGRGGIRGNRFKNHFGTVTQRENVVVENIIWIFNGLRVVLIKCRIKSKVSNIRPSRVVEKGMLAGIFNNHAREILKHQVEGFPGMFISGPKYFEIEGTSFVTFITRGKRTLVSNKFLKSTLLRGGQRSGTGGGWRRWRRSLRRRDGSRRRRGSNGRR